MSTVMAQRPLTRIAIITGAAQGIGESIALRLAADGLDVAVTDLPGKRDKLDGVVEAITAMGRKSIAIVGDVSVEADVVNIIDATVLELGGLDVMVANAGLFGTKSFMDTTVEDWDKVFSVNTRGVMLCFKHAAKEMVQQGRGGCMIAAASMAAKQGFAYVSTYSASKFAVRGLVQSIALELQRHDITVNAYAPGLIATEMTSSPEDESNGGPVATLLKSVGLPVDTKLSVPSDVAALVSYMVKPEARLLTGQCISVNGGLVLD